MKNGLPILLTLFVLIPFSAVAQGTDNDLENDFGARISAAVDKKIVKGFHVTAELEGRMNENMSDFSRYQAGVSVSYKALDFLKLGAGYLYIGKKNSTDEWKPRHRIYADATLSYKTGGWRFALKERISLTHKDVGNKFQSVPNAVELRSRAKVSYKASALIEPYMYVELRNIFNDPACSATWNTTSLSYSDYSFRGYTDTYFNRVRGCLGTEFNLNKHNAIDFFILGDYCHEKNVDTNAEGTKLKSLTYDRAFNVNVGIGYTFSF